jgi:dUTP pyrophosphatase
MEVKIKKLTENAVVPRKAHPTDAGFDLTATSMHFDDDGNIVYGTGLAFEIPEGYVGLIFPRSSIAKYDLVLTNSVGVIDSHYRGEVMAKMKVGQRITSETLEKKINIYEVGERIAQMIIMPLPEIELKECDELSETDRGTKGYGGSGR